jgi:hypothetical protein
MCQKVYIRIIPYLIIQRRATAEEKKAWCHRTLLTDDGPGVKSDLKVFTNKAGRGNE